MRSIITLFTFLLLWTHAQAQTARVQIIHNSPTPTVDIYANDNLLLNDFEFRKATPFVDVPAGVEINIGIALDNSNSVDDVIANFPVTLADGGKYIVIANGIVGGNPGFNLEIFDMAVEASMDASEVGVLFFHGSPDAPEVDILANGNVLFDDIEFAEYAGYANVPAAEYKIDVTPAGDNSTIVASYSADISLLGGGAGVIFASGFLSGDTPAFEPWVALANGLTFALPAYTAPVGNARVQVIHNSPTPTVDVYANDDLLLDDFEFRTASPFVDVPSGVEIDLGIALDNSTSADDAIANFPVTLEDGKTYVVIANGIVGGNPGFNLEIFDMGAETADTPDNVGLLFFHGSPNAPDVDILAGGNVLFDDVAYSEFAAYANVPAAEYKIDVTPANDNSAIVASYTADLSGLAGGAGVVFASGFLSGDTPAFEPWVALTDGTTFPLPAYVAPVGNARVQVIHNSPTPTVDVYANSDLLLNDFEFRTASPFVDVPAGVEIDLGIALDNSTSADDAIANFPVTLEDGKTYVVIANGIVGGNPGFNLEIFDMGAEAANDPANVGLLFFHGSPDAPDVDILAGGNVLFDDVAYSEFAGYANVPAAEYKIDVTPANDNSAIVASYTADLSGLAGGAGVVFASGFLSGDTPAFEPWVALTDGTTFPLPAYVAPVGNARVQVIHNSPTPTVDVYANSDLLLNDFEFRTASPFVDVPAGVEIDLGIALDNSTSADDAIANFPVTLEDGKTYVVIANGIVGGNPGFNLEIFDMGAEAANDPANVGLLFFHGSPDAPDVDILAGGNVLFDDVAYSEFADYANVPAAEYKIDVTPANDNSAIVASYTADLSGLAGGAGVVFASGFLSGDTPAFEPWVALTDGTTFPLPAYVAPVGNARVQVIHNSPTPTVDVYANSDLLLNDFEFRTASPFVDVPAGVEIDLGIALDNSTSADDAIANFPVTLEDGKTYVVIANGIVGGNPGFNLEIFDMGAEAANDPANVGLLFFHGSPDAPDVDILAGGNVLFDDVAYSEFAGYANVPAAEYKIDVTPANDNSAIVASYTADLSGLAGGAGVVFASGFLSGDTPAFEPWVALTDGTTFPLPAYVAPPVGSARVQVIHNSPTPTVDVYANSDLLLNDFAFRTASPFVDVPSGVEINLGIALRNSTSASDAIANFPVTLEDGKSYVVIASGVVGGTPAFNLEIFDMGAETADDPNNVGLLFYHGSPDAPEVDIAVGGTPIFDNVSYSEFSGYINVPAANTYQLDVTPGNDNSNVLASYQADFSWWKGKTAVVFATGYLSGEFPSFEPWVALPNGGTFPLPRIIPPTPTARVQVIHNSPTPNVDVYANDGRLIDNFAFRTATPFIDVPAGVEINLGIAPDNSSSAADAIANFPVTLEEGKRYVVIANGIVGGNPGFDLEIFDMGIETPDDPSTVALLFFHGSPDAPEVDIAVGGTPIFDNVSYGEFSGYRHVNANTIYKLDVTPANDNNAIVASYKGDFSWWKGNSAVIFASGFLGGGDPGFVPYVALSNGGTFPLPVDNNMSISNNSPIATNSLNSNSNVFDLSVFPNPAQNYFRIETNLTVASDLTVEMIAMDGRTLQTQRFNALDKGPQQLDVQIKSDIRAGQYILRVQTNEGMQTKMLTIMNN